MDTIRRIVVNNVCSEREKQVICRSKQKKILGCNGVSYRELLFLKAVRKLLRFEFWYRDQKRWEWTQGSWRGNKFSLEDALEGEESCAVATGRQQTSTNNRNTIMMMILKWWQCNFSYSGALANLQKAIISLVMPICPSVCLSLLPSAWNYNSAPTGPIVRKFLTWVFFKNLSRK